MHSFPRLHRGSRISLAAVLLALTLASCSPTLPVRPTLPELPQSASRIPKPFPDPPQGQTVDGQTVYAVSDLVAWITEGAAAYADARAQGLACTTFYNSLRSQQ